MEKQGIKLLSKFRAFDKNLAIVTPERRISYREMLKTVPIVCQKCKQLGIKRGDRVAIIAANSAESIIIILALWHIGAIAVPISVRLPNSQVGKIINQIGAVHVLNSGYNWEKQVSENITLLNTKELFEPPKETVSITENIALKFDQLVTIVFTSGSSGNAKAVLHNFGNHYYSALGSNQNIPFGKGDCWLLSLPLFHVGGLAILMRSFLAGGTIALPGKEMAMTEAMEKLRASHISLVATQLFRLLQEKRGREALKKLKAILLGGGPIPPNLVNRALELELPIHTSYGSTEMASQITATSPNATGEQLQTSGKLLNYREINLTAEGEIMVKGKTLFPGYWNKQGVEIKLDSRGWFATGDIGHLNENGYLEVKGRKDNMFISGGENIHPEEIEKVLCSIDAIEQALVVPLEDAEFGMRPTAFIKAKTGFQPDIAEIRMMLSQKIARFKIPVYFFPWPPETTTTGIKLIRKHFCQLVKENFGDKNCNSHL